MNKIKGRFDSFWQFTNVVAVLSAISVFLYIPSSLFTGHYTLAMMQGVDVVCILSVLGFNHFGYNKLSRHVYILVLNSFVLLSASIIGYNAQIQEFFYITYIIPFLLFGVKDYKNIIGGILSSILFFNIYQYIYPYFVQYNMDANTQHATAVINIWMKFVLFGFAIYILSYYNSKTEAELAESNQKLQEQAAELLRSNNDLEQFAAIISHDLKAPVRNVSSFMTLLRRRHGAAMDADALHFIDLSKASADRMSMQIDDLLTYSKLGRNLPPAALVDVNNIVTTIRIELGEKIKEKNTSIFAESLPILSNVHSSMVHHVLQNLIANGIKFNTNSTPEVRINCITMADKYVFSVSDNGIGIDEVYKDKLFQMFKRLHTDTEYEGTGIGLAVCKKIVEFYGGIIWMESKPGEGSSFFFTLPRRRSDHNQIYLAKPSTVSPFPRLAVS
jgi:signal transduction histidine kinase